MDVVCALLYKNQKLLLGQRPLHKNMGGKWEFPGGKVHAGESLKKALSRELEEELALSVNSFFPIGSVSHDQHQLHSFMAPLPGFYLPKEHRAMAWSSLKNISLYDLCPSDQETLSLFGEDISKLLISRSNQQNL